jgi:23S rRNA (cytidine1920-2'-O)/16S rRNA (cytidine1409-2'-O)-methyltransferase
MQLNKLRIDELLVQKGFAPTKSQAKSMILQGLVFYNSQPVKKAGQMVNTEGELKVTEINKYVSRGAKKIEGAIKEFEIDIKNKIIADVGASTGGFTDYLLQNGASKVYAIDVGRDQLAEKLKHDPRVINLENTNIKDLDSLPESADLAVADLSYISLRKVLPSIFKLAPEAIVLLKPQFECGPGVVNKQGIIIDPEIQEQTINDFENWCNEKGYKIKAKTKSPITGKVGNQEWLYWLEN